MKAVANRSSAKWEEVGVPPGAYLKFNGKRVAVDIATLKRRGTSDGTAQKPRLRFDKVVAWLMERLQATLGKTLPVGMTVLLTVTAPIRLPAKTAAALEEKVQALLKRRALRHGVRDVNTTMHGNRVRIRALRHGSRRAPKMIGFVHNPDTDPLLLFNLTGEMLQLASAEAVRRAPRADLERWLVVISARGISCLAAYRYIYSQLLAATGFEKVVMVFGDGSVGVLAERKPTSRSEERGPRFQNTAPALRIVGQRQWNDGVRAAENQLSRVAPQSVTRSHGHGFRVFRGE